MWNYPWGRSQNVDAMIGRLPDLEGSYSGFSYFLGEEPGLGNKSIGTNDC